MLDNFAPRWFFAVVVALASVAAGQDLPGQETPQSDQQSEDQEKIRAAIEAYVAAFNAKDVDKLISFWSTDGVYVSLSSGERFVGHDALKDEFTAILTDDDAPKLALQMQSIEFISPNVALEYGTAVIARSESSESTAFRAVYVERDGRWLIDRVSEEVVEERPSNYEHLQGLEFLVGQWTNGDDGGAIEIDCQWTANQNFLSRTYKVYSEEDVESSGLQIIGWDAKRNQIRSWLFDSNGSFVQGEWSHNGDAWIVQSVATLADGASGSATSMIGQTDRGEITWRKFNRIVDGQLLPNTEEVILQRK
ncbi:YybH family protein [Rhodopirellula sp. JC639]|uniref:YybH family protein n=1 Tax=Stieleria mannarensis TaxID=2755585 RepID=UPI001602D6C6|nr:nuclear transport factor 2 family protein [Rhodopirellula sp. JC639]